MNKWKLKEYMTRAYISSIAELSRITGINKKTLFNRISEPTTLRVYEIMALHKVLKFSNDDLVKLITGGK